MERVVHLDLKGAPPKVAYLEKVLLCVKLWGATGVLMEWEDTFPYAWDLADIGSQGGSGGDGVYLQDEVTHILNFASQRGIKIIQLVQTFGHMEFVLKHPKYADLREVRRSPAVLCPSKTDSKVLVQNMLAQVLEAQPDAEYIHIGADEVWHLGSCDDCKARAASLPGGPAALFLEHVQEVAKFVRMKNPNVTVLMWDDMMRNIDLDVLKQYEVHKLVQPVVWDYNPKDRLRIRPDMWTKYSMLFPEVWAASAFKGANGSCQIISPVIRYTSNQEAWQQEISRNSYQIKFKGIILTGWSRYDHYAALCELLPAATPSLASCLRLHAKPPDVPNETVISEYLSTAEWPCESVARCVHTFMQLREKAFVFIYGDFVTTWLNPWQIENSYTNPMQVESIAATAKQLMASFTAFEKELSLNLNAMTGRRSAEEWSKTYVQPVVSKVNELLKASESRCQSEPSVSPLNTLFLWNKYWNGQSGTN